MVLVEIDFKCIEHLFIAYIQNKQIKDLGTLRNKTKGPFGH